MSRRVKDRTESATVEIDGQQYTGTVWIRDVGRDKVMFDVSFCGLLHQDKSVFRRGDVQVAVWSKLELEKLVRKWLAERNSATAKESQ